MDKKKRIIIISSTIIIAIVLIIVILLVFNKNIELGKEKNKYNDDPSITRGKFICNKTILEKEGLNIQILQNIYFDQNSIDSYNNWTVYNITSEDEYNRLKESLTDCNDTYYIDGKIMCRIYDKELVNKQISELPIMDYISKLRKQDFNCEKVRDEAYFEDDDLEDYE